jgi:hypothetical protein
VDGGLVLAGGPEVETAFGLGDDAAGTKLISNYGKINRAARKDLPSVATVTGHGNQELAKLNDEIVLIRLEFPTDFLSSWASQLLSELLQTSSDLLVLGENGAEVRQRGRHLGPDTNKLKTMSVTAHCKRSLVDLISASLTGSSIRP